MAEPIEEPKTFASASPTTSTHGKDNATEAKQDTSEQTLLCVDVSKGDQHCPPPFVSLSSGGITQPVTAVSRDSVVSKNEATSPSKRPMAAVSPSLSGTPALERAPIAEGGSVTVEPIPSIKSAGEGVAVSSDSSANGSTAKPEEKTHQEKKRPTRRTAALPSAKYTRTMGSSLFPRPCMAHTPTLEELQSYTFSDYIRDEVMASALPKFEDSDDESVFMEDDWCKTTMPLIEGIAKVTLPDGFWKEEGIGSDRTGRGPAWQEGQPLGDLVLQSPIAQHILGMAGVYEYTFTDNPATTMAEFRKRADEYREGQIGVARDEADEEATDDRMIQLDRLFWKRLGPTMPAAWYGADQEGTLFGDDPASGWNVGELDSCLHVLSRVPGVTTPYLYAGMWASVFCAHTEDMNLLSINYLHAGAPKIWYAIAPGPDSKRFEALCEFQYSVAARGCKEFMRHKRYLLSPMVLHKAGIKYTTCIQRPGDAIITFPGGYHFGFNTGFNMAEATNFGIPEWIPYGLQAKICLCRPDSVRIDMNKLTSLLDMFESDKGRKPKLTWKEWSRKREEKKEKKLARMRAKKGANDPPAADVVSTPKPKSNKKKIPLSEQERKKEFWIEVVKPAPKIAAPKTKKPKVVEEEAGRGKRKRKKTFRAALWEAEIKKEVAPVVVHKEIWHLAKPIGKKGVDVNARVLCLLAGTVMRSSNNPILEENGDCSDEEEDEQCFAGQAIEIADNHIRIRIDGLPKTEDVWLPLDQSKVFLDGGRWAEDTEQFEMPERHYWKEVDSKRLRPDG
uniref:JmjC domain-containing protein n=1 Tax=Entomoneis paludosa TaxID=265537 RepID=A0A7S2VBK3_9STRA|mmetsp:Transcript_1319/g.2896  ORF Transcript_1319/g.2896 Transcript_1319/m.2896 type:complete len:788 (+) Transcript_1319:547-2910(+)|eukprot:CAMPEP_0172459346 /NCGR_PEP_ID=MMETSP1065-20121228/32177_1 /TAXON_ID=265537 /ORGANISM="Amphiprora paludosa, Strain CCMP125" /LENGTH=787 /DNA_ID=CAMNT_0013213995 /DNA_START=482 /DNA_END=2845 /DNA_ORIENTATION=-